MRCGEGMFQWGGGGAEGDEGLTAGGGMPRVWGWGDGGGWEKLGNWRSFTFARDH